MFGVGRLIRMLKGHNPPRSHAEAFSGIPPRPMAKRDRLFIWIMVIVAVLALIGHAVWH